MAYKNRDWHQHLVDQSKTDHIYSLIHGYLQHDWDPGHDLDFVVVRAGSLPPAFDAGIPALHIANSLPKESYCFPGNGYILLDNNYLTTYLEAAKRLKMIEDFEDRGFIELVFFSEAKYTPEENEHTSGYYNFDFDNEHIDAPEELEDKEEGLAIAYELLRTGKDRNLALRYAETGKEYLDDKQVSLHSHTPATLEEIERNMTGYSIVAAVYAWNNLIDKAAQTDDLYLHYPPLWDKLEGVIEPYIEMLIAKKQLDYLNFIFADMLFRERFLHHYEAFVSILINDRYQLSNTMTFVTIYNKVRACERIYL